MLKFINFSNFCKAGTDKHQELNMNNIIVVIGLSRIEQDANLTVNAKFFNAMHFQNFFVSTKEKMRWEEIAVQKEKFLQINQNRLYQVVKKISQRNKLSFNCNTKA